MSLASTLFPRVVSLRQGCRVSLCGPLDLPSSHVAPATIRLAWLAVAESTPKKRIEHRVYRGARLSIQSPELGHPYLLILKRVLPPLLFGPKWGDTLDFARGGGWTQFRRSDIHSGTLGFLYYNLSTGLRKGLRRFWAAAETTCLIGRSYKHFPPTSCSSSTFRLPVFSDGTLEQQN